MSSVSLILTLSMLLTSSTADADLSTTPAQDLQLTFDSAGTWCEVGSVSLHVKNVGTHLIRMSTPPQDGAAWDRSFTYSFSTTSDPGFGGGRGVSRPGPSGTYVELVPGLIHTWTIPLETIPHKKGTYTLGVLLPIEVHDVEGNIHEISLDVEQTLTLRPAGKKCFTVQAG